jgi:chromatin segregation and condensation protein Rec8/ScpA/Scc1 (kleisin family)
MNLFDDDNKTFLDKMGNWLVDGDLSLTDFVKEKTYSVAPKKETKFSLSKSLKEVGGFVKDVIQGTARSGARVGLTLLGKDKLDTTDPLVKKVSNVLYGKGEVKSLGKTIKDFPQEASKFGISEKISKPLAIPLVIGATILDFTGGGGKDDILKTIIKIDNVGDALKLGSKIGVADDLIDDFAKNVVKVKNVDEAKRLVSSIENIQKTSKVATQTIEDPLIQEARKYKSAEEFVKVQGTPVKVERGFITSIKEELPDLKVAGQYVPRATDTLAIKARNLVKDNLETAERMALKGTDDDAVATGAELLKYYNENKLYDRAAELANTMARNLTEQGRSIQAASILGRLTPEGQVKFAAREIQKYNEAIDNAKGGLFGLKKKIPEITEQQTKTILNEMEEISKITDITQKSMRFQKLQNYITDLVPSPLIPKIIGVWKAGLLTGWKTTGVNIFSNVSHFGFEIAKDVPATVVDSVASLFTGKRTLGLTTKGVGGGIKEGFEKGLQYLKTGYDERGIGLKLDWKRVNFGKSKVAKGIQKYEETIFRVLGAEDQPFYYGAKARSLASQAKAEAINKGLRGSEATKFIDELIQNPTDKMLNYAVLDAETAVYQNRTLLGKAASAIQKYVPGGEFVVPFGRTPSAVATQIINYTPVGIVKTIIQNIGKGKFDQRLFAQGIGRGITGTGVLFIGGELMKKGLMTLDRPTGEREQKLWELEGRKPNSIYNPITKNWDSIQVLGPLGNVLLIGGQFQDKLSKEGSPTKAMIDATWGSVKGFSEQTFLTSINQLVSTLSDPERSAESYVGNTLSSFVPTILSDVARATDTKERRTENILEKFMARIPGLREELEPQITALGEEKERVGSFLDVMINPLRPSPAQTSPVIEELRRLMDAGFSISPTLLGDKEGYKILTQEQNTDLWKRSGDITNQKLQSLFNQPEYQKLKDDVKAKTIESFVEKSKLIARTEKVLELTEGLTGQELLMKLSELKKDGLMTREVYNAYQKLR